MFKIRGSAKTGTHSLPGLGLRSAQAHLCPSSHAVTRGLSSETLPIFPASGCYYRRAAAHPASSLEEPAPLAPPWHLSPPVGDTESHECITGVPWRQHPGGGVERLGARDFLGVGAHVTTAVSCPQQPLTFGFSPGTRTCPRASLTSSCCSGSCWPSGSYFLPGPARAALGSDCPSCLWDP